jgi:hypothetical protein
MKATNTDRVNLRIRESLWAERQSNATRVSASWQSGVKTLSGNALPKLRLEFAPGTPRSFSDLKTQDEWT